MPFKNPEKRKEYMKAYLKKYMLSYRLKNRELFYHATKRWKIKKWKEEHDTRSTEANTDK